jgi:hypothetical protein
MGNKNSIGRSIDNIPNQSTLSSNAPAFVSSSSKSVDLDIFDYSNKEKEPNSFPFFYGVKKSTNEFSSKNIVFGNGNEAPEETPIINIAILGKNYQNKILEIATCFNQESIEAISNLFADFFSFFSFTLVFVLMKPQIIILKSFLAESLYSLSDTTKSFLLILGTDLLVGFHSPHGWEVFLEGFLRHLGLPENVEFMSLFVATFPVFLDTVFKYWIFRSLNKISPSTVATYHNMIE